MQPIGPLMWEHRTIEQAVSIVAESLTRMRRTGVLETRLLELSVDFIRTYADRTHHGKEEDILFKALQDRPLSAEERTVVDELMAEHVRARQLTKEVVMGIETHVAAGSGGTDMVLAALEQLCLLYPAHIEKEDKHLFHQVMRYFTREEMDRMLEEFREFDRQLIHERYAARIDEMRHAVASG